MALVIAILKSSKSEEEKREEERVGDKDFYSVRHILTVEAEIVVNKVNRAVRSEKPKGIFRSFCSDLQKIINRIGGD
jgi:hypothetical protein